jgi:hypothetical protein
VNQIAKNAAFVDFARLNRGAPVDYGSNISKAMRAAREKGKDFVIVRGVDDIGGPVDQIIALNPKGLVKNAKTGSTVFGGLLGLGDILMGRQEPSAADAIAARARR